MLFFGLFFFFLETCNYSPESRGINMCAPSKEWSRGRWRRQTSEIQITCLRGEKWSRISIFVVIYWKNKSEAFPPPLYIWAALIFTCSFVEMHKYTDADLGYWHDFNKKSSVYFLVHFVKRTMLNESLALPYTWYNETSHFHTVTQSLWHHY